MEKELRSVNVFARRQEDGKSLFGCFVWGETVELGQIYKRDKGREKLKLISVHKMPLITPFGAHFMPGVLWGIFESSLNYEDHNWAPNSEYFGDEPEIL